MSEGDVDSFDVVVIGAGFAGMYALYNLRRLGLSVRVYEAGDGVGRGIGTGTREPVAMSRAWITLTRSPRNSNRSGSGRSGIRHSPKSWHTPTTLPIA